jgi:hypothetical protein
MLMFSQEVLVLDVDAFTDATADNMARVLTGAADHPRRAREMRSGVVISFEQLGVGNPAADSRARTFLSRVAARCPGLGYFLNGDPPTYHLCDMSKALAFAAVAGRQVMTMTSCTRMPACWSALELSHSPSVITRTH